MIKNLYEKYKHAIPVLVYLVIYLIWFSYLEEHVKHPEHLIHMKIDDMIPFCEYFVVPYLLWFGYIACVVVYFIFHDRREYYQNFVFLATGMTIFLVISTIWPNGHNLRPDTMPRDNIFTALVEMLYRSDTPTNLWPSIHVYNSLGAHIAIMKSRTLKDKRWVHVGSFILCVSIILSTMFIKQHSVFDVMTGFVMALVMYILVYEVDVVAILWVHAIRAKRRKISGV